MLQAMKSQAAKWVIRVLAVFLIISFAAWGIGDIFVGQGYRSDVANVGDTKITAQEFNQSFRNQVERLRQLLGPELDSEQAREFGLVETTLNRLIARRLLELYAAENGILVGDDQIRQRIHIDPAFHGPAGTFDQATFENTLFRRGIGEQTYVEELRGQIRLDHLTDIISHSSVAPDALTEFVYHYRNDKRTARYIILPRPAAETIGTPSGSDLSEFHRTQAARFTAPERREVTAIHLDPDVVAKEIQPTQDELMAEYESQLATLSEPERRQVSQILFGNEGKAKTAVEALRAGRTIADVAKTMASMEENTTNLGLLTREELPDDIAEAAFALQPKTPSPPVKSPLGWHVLVVEKIHPRRQPSFKEVRPNLQANLAREQAIDALVKLANQLEDTLAGGATLEEAAGQLNTKLVRLRGIESSGKTAKGLPDDKLLKSRRFLRAAFETGENQLSDLTESLSGGYFILRVDRVDPPALEPFDKVRKDVEAAWRRDKVTNAAEDRAKKPLEEVRAGRALEDVAAEAKLTVSITPAFTRFNQGKNPVLSSALTTELFRIKLGEAVGGPTANGYAIAVLNKIEHAKAKHGDPVFDTVGNELRTSIAADLLDQYTRSLRQVYPVSINTGALDRLFDEGVVTR